jgi:hypothetical protein
MKNNYKENKSQVKDFWISFGFRKMQNKLNIKTYLKHRTTWNTKHAKKSYLIGGYRLPSLFATYKRKNTTYPSNF